MITPRDLQITPLVPEIDSVVVRSFLDEFRRHVERSALDGGEHQSAGRHGASESEITKLDHAISADENILRLSLEHGGVPSYHDG